MPSPLPVNAKDPNRNRDVTTDPDQLSNSFDRTSSTARLSSSPVPPAYFYGSSPARSTNSIRTYGSTGGADLDRIASSHSLFRPLSNNTSSLSIMDLPEGQVAKVVKRHLVETSPVPSTHNEDSNYQSDDSTGITSVHQLPGGSITHGIYKWTEAVENEQLQRKRTRSFSMPRQEPSDPALARLKDPGGFRRHFVFNRAAKQGKQPPDWVTRSFVDFLALYGHFGGEDLSDEEEVEDEGEMTGGSIRVDEESPLIRRPQATATQGTATPAKAVFLLLKSFVGTGNVLSECFRIVTSLITVPLFARQVSCSCQKRKFLKFLLSCAALFIYDIYSFYNGGLIFSTTLLTAIAAISLYSFLLLVETRNKVPASFGDIGGILFGPTMRMAVLVAITLSQVISKSSSWS